MKSITKLFEKEYSDIKGLQHAQRVRYCMIRQQEGPKILYGIKIVATNFDGHIAQVQLERLSDSFDYVFDLMTLLYENAVPISSCLAIISDLSPYPSG